MTSRQLFAVLVLAVLSSPSLGQTDQTRPSTYDECITDSMKGVGSDVAANAIIASCRNQFPEHAEAAAPQEENLPQPEKAASGSSRGLTSEELGMLSATAFVSGNSYRMTFRNGNENLTLTEVTIAVWDKSNPEGRQEYSQKVRIGPLQSDSAKYTVVTKGPGFDWSSTYEDESSWMVTAAKGMD